MLEQFDTILTSADLAVDSGGVTLAVSDHGGDGPPLVLLHGGGRTLRDWDGVLPALLPRHRVVTVDIRGHGQSTPVDEWRFEDAVADLDAVVAALALQRPVIAGHSLGGMIACLYGEANPGCAGVANIDGSGTALPRTMPGTPDGRERLRELVAEQARAFGTRAASPARGDAQWVEREVAARRDELAGAGIAETELEAVLRRTFVAVGQGLYQENPSPRCHATSYAACRRVETFDVLRRLRCPALYLKATRIDQADEHAELMAAFTAGCVLEQREIAAGNPRVRMEQIDCGHMVPLERPAELGALLAEWAVALA